MSEIPDTFKKLAVPFDKAAYKDVSFGARSFTTIDAYYIVERMTEVFGLCGVGWGFDDLKFEKHGDSVSCIGRVWYSAPESENNCYVPAVGDAKVMYDNVPEAFKKAQTNLLSKASSFIGVGLSVYQGKGIDDPYLDREAEGKDKQRDEFDKKFPADKEKKSSIQDQQIALVIDKIGLERCLQWLVGKGQIEDTNTVISLWPEEVKEQILARTEDFKKAVMEDA